MKEIVLAILFASQPMNRCGDIDILKAYLKDNYGETRVAEADINNGGKLTVLSSGKTWTIILSRKSGIACVASAGVNWRVSLPGDPA